MNQIYFESLPLNKKVEFLKEFGLHIDSRAIYNQVHFRLYRVYDFYAEACYDARSNAIKSICTIEQEVIAEEYIDLREMYLSNSQVQPPKK